MSASEVEKHSISIPTSLSEGVRTRVGARGFSGYVARAVARQLERDALDDVLAEMAAAHGPADEGELTTILERLAQ